MPADSRSRTPREQRAAEAARELLLVADGYEDAGHPQLAHRSRNVARELLWALSSLEDERSARQTIQAAHADAVALLGQRAYEAIAS